MDCSTADVPSIVVHDSPVSDDSSDDKPLIKRKTISASPKKTKTKDDTSLKSNGTNTKKADLNRDDSSDNEPLIKITKMSSKAAKKISVDSKQQESLEEDNGSDDEPLSELREKLHPQHQRKSPGGPPRKTAPLMKSKRNAARKKVKYTESSSDSSDDEALAAMKTKLTKTPKEQKTSANSKQTKPKHKDKTPEGDDSSCTDDDVPLSKLLIKPCSEEKQSHEDTHSSISVSKKDKSASDDSSDDEPLIKKKTISQSSQKKTKTKDDTSLKSNGTNTKKAESLDEDNTSDDEPLSELREKLHPQRQKKSPGGPSRKAAPVLKSKRNAARKKVKYTESFSDSSDDEALATMKRKLTKTPKEQKTSANSKQAKPKHKDKSTEESLDEDNSSDYEPLSELKKKLNPQRQRKSPGGPSRKAAPVMKSKRNAARKKDSSSDDDVPLVNLIAKRKKPMKKNTKMTTASRSRASRKRRVSSGNISDDEPLIKAARHPQVTKLLRIVLRRCDGEEGVDTGTGSLNKSSAATTIEEKTLKEESEGSEKSPEEE
ncbi:nucleolar protein dao-5-like isoform X2 [Epinephelus fuscoguttatus]|uniref:nucleolar protein dao-5-like isoform X2 n=1 Tax=Epinephelus fuscoguttatus TaxID=293821 RepID=UPI0020D0A109|nr:nucleolar protein dao-5-like isoform X2 [Epinephelus fuscoguttatus]